MLRVRPAVNFLVHDPDRCSDSRYNSFCSKCMRKPRVMLLCQNVVLIKLYFHSLLVRLFSINKLQGCQFSMASVSTQKACKSSSSSSSSTPLWEHDVFLSFYGEDTRKNFTDHLYTSLKQKGINAYRDNEKLEQGTPIASGLMKAIEESKYAIIVISEHYAFSKWCLNELVKILECMKDKWLRVLPVFYHVNPSDVGNQRKTFEKAFLKHKEDPEVSLEKIQKWRAALTEVSEICGRHLIDSYESEDIQEITKSIFDELNREFPDFSEHLVGIHPRVMEMRNLFGTMSDDVHYIGFWGIPGIGKTTLAYVIFNRIRHQFEASSFICNVRETVEKHDLVYLQKQLVSETLKVKGVNIWNHLQGIKVIKKGLLNKKVLIVIDDADKDEQLQALVGNRDWFGLGSRIIITSKDKHLLERHRVVTIHKVNGLDNDEALELFSWTVFNQTYPKKDFVDLSNDYLKYAKGVPLALKVLGSSLIGRPRKEWEDYLHQLEKIPEGQILDKLEISKRGLNDTEQNLFLDKNRVAHMEGFGCYKNIETPKDKIVHHKSPQELGKCDRDSQLEDDEQLARALQVSRYVENVESPPPRYGHGNIYQPMPMYYPLGSRISAGFYTEIGYGRYLNGLNAVWHPVCFPCHSCNLPISDNEFSTSGNYPYHQACYKENCHPKCDVRKHFMPTNPAGLIEYRARPFWIQKYCPFHEHDNTPRCCSCERMEGSSHKFSEGHYDSSYAEDPNHYGPSTSGDVWSENDEEIDRAIAESLLEESQTGTRVIDRDSQLEDDEQLARALQESLNLENVESPPPRYGHGNIYQPMTMPMYYPLGSRICAGCYTEIGYGRYLNCLNAVWHPECFRCHSCTLPISDNEFSTSGNYPYHKACYKENYHPKCDVCKHFIPTNPAGLIEYRAHPFWIQKYCPFHEHDNTPRCCSCERMEPQDTRYVSLNDGRRLCLECLDTAVMDTYECQPLYLDIQEFYEGLNMKVEQQVPLLLVERQALNEAREGEKNGHYHMPETRGLCLSEEQTISVPRRTRNGAGKRNVNMVTEPFRLIRRCKVTAILILYGLPRLLTGSILAHEMMHAWLRLKGYRILSQDVEEGICQVLAHMWLSSKLMSGSNVASSSSSTSTVLKWDTVSQYEKKLGEFFKHQIESDISHVYGDGFRAGLQAVQKYGLSSVVKSALNGDGFRVGQQAVHKYGIPSVVKSALKLKARSPKAPALFASKAKLIQRSTL